MLRLAEVGAFGFPHDLKSPRSVRRNGQLLDPGPVDRRHPASKVLEHQGHAGVKPDSGAPVTDACVIFPTEVERLISTKLGADHDLKMCQEPVIEVSGER